jgi:hypothetical protein
MLTRLLAALGLAPLGQVAHAREAVARVRAAERVRGKRERDSSAEQLAELRRKLQEAHERHISEYAERSTLKKALWHYWDKLNRPDSTRDADDRRVALQFAVNLKARVTGAASPSPGDELLTSVCTDYANAVARWQSGALPADIRQVSSAGMQWAMPSLRDDAHSRDDTGAFVSVLPVDELTTVRQFVAGGAMLDISGGMGRTSIPRIVLGDFQRAYVAESDAAQYHCLVGNVLESGVRGWLLPDRVAITPSTTQSFGPSVPEAPELTLEQWMDGATVGSGGAVAICQDW